MEELKQAEEPVEVKEEAAEEDKVQPPQVENLEETDEK